MASISHEAGEPTQAGTSDTLPQRAPVDGESQVPPGGIGGRCITNPRLAASEIKLHRRALRLGWKVTEEHVEYLPGEAFDIAKHSTDERARLQAMNLIREMHKDNQNAEIALDKMERLDSGTSTENVAAVQYIKGIDEGDV